MKKKITLKDILILQAVIAIYTLSTVMAKLASGHPTLSLNFFLFYGAELVILAIYALLWQQMIKKIRIIHCLYKPGHGPALVPYLGRSNIS